MQLKGFVTLVLSMASLTLVDCQNDSGLCKTAYDADSCRAHCHSSATYGLEQGYNPDWTLGWLCSCSDPKLTCFGYEPLRDVYDYNQQPLCTAQGYYTSYTWVRKYLGPPCDALPDSDCSKACGAAYRISKDDSKVTLFPASWPAGCTCAIPTATLDSSCLLHRGSGTTLEGSFSFTGSIDNIKAVVRTSFANNVQCLAAYYQTEDDCYGAYFDNIVYTRKYLSKPCSQDHTSCTSKCGAAYLLASFEDKLTLVPPASVPGCDCSHLTAKWEGCDTLTQGASQDYQTTFTGSFEVPGIVTVQLVSQGVTCRADYVAPGVEYTPPAALSAAFHLSNDFSYRALALLPLFWLVCSALSV